MKCVYCNENFYVKRSILELFSSKKEYICDKCYKKYKMELSVENIQLDKYDCMVISMFKKRYYIDYNYFFKEYSKIIDTFIYKENYKLLFFDYLKLSDNVFETLDYISKLNKSNLIVFCFYTIS